MVSAWIQRETVCSSGDINNVEITSTKSDTKQVKHEKFLMDSFGFFRLGSICR